MRARWRRERRTSLKIHRFRSQQLNKPYVPHQPVNLSDTEPAHAIVARNDPDEQESVVLYDPDRDELIRSRSTT